MEKQSTAREEVGPLSLQQEEMVGRLRTFPACAPRYDCVHLFELRGPIDLDRLARAIADVVTRHPTLRTTIETGNDGDVQRVHAAMLEPVAFSTADTADQLAATLLEARHGTRAATSGRPLFRARVVTLGPDRHILAFTIHHLLCDGLSLFVLWRDLSECYRARRERASPTLPALPLTYVEYARRQRQAAPVCAARAVPFWRAVAGDTPRTAPWPRGTACGNPFETSVGRLVLPADAAGRVRSVARAARVTPFLVLLAASTAAAARVVGSDILFGTDVATREERWTRDLFGHLLNTRMTRGMADRRLSLYELVRRTRETWLAAEAYQDAYLNEVLRVLEIPWLPSVMLDEQEYGANPTFPAVSVTPVPVHCTDPYWREFLLTWRMTPAEWSGDIVFRPSCVAPSIVDEISDEIVQVLALPD